MSRWQAFLIHLLISAMIALGFLLVCRFYWFQGPLFNVTGGLGLIEILVPVDVILGPILTLLVFKADKPTLKLDLTLIACVQVAALVYGAIVMIQARPLFVVLYHQELRVLRPLDFSEVPWRQAILSPTQYVRVSSDRGALAEIEETVSQITGRTPPHLNMGNYQPLANYSDELRSALVDEQNVIAKKFGERVGNVLAKLPKAADQYGLIPLVARGELYLGVVARDNMELVEIISKE